jgi:hypothetical protein
VISTTGPNCFLPLIYLLNGMCEIRRYRFSCNAVDLFWFSRKFLKWKTYFIYVRTYIKLYLPSPSVLPSYVDRVRENTRNNFLIVCEIRAGIYIFCIARPVGLELSIRNLHITKLSNFEFLKICEGKTLNMGVNLVSVVKFCDIRKLRKGWYAL